MERPSAQQVQQQQQQQKQQQQQQKDHMAGAKEAFIAMEKALEREKTAIRKALDSRVERYSLHTLLCLSLSL